MSFTRTLFFLLRDRMGSTKWVFSPSANTIMTAWLLINQSCHAPCHVLRPPALSPLPSAPPAAVRGRTCIKRGKSVRRRGRDGEGLQMLPELPPWTLWSEQGKAECMTACGVCWDWHFTKHRHRLDVWITGDIRPARLGLDETEWERLSAQVKWDSDKLQTRRRCFVSNFSF